MKVSFSLSSSSKPSKSTSSSSPDQSPNKQFITEFNPSNTTTNSTSKTPIVIPPIPNDWNPQTHAKPSNLQFEPNPNSAVDSIASNGLNLRDKKGSTSDSDSDSESLSSIDRLMLMKLRSDLKRLPDHGGLEEFDDVTVENFAPAYLKGYGWREGRGIGKNAKEDVKVVQYCTRRTAREGLGFVRTDGADR